MRIQSIIFGALLATVFSHPATAGERVLRDALVEQTSLIDLGSSLSEWQEETINPAAKKSVGKAFGLSLLLPGLGQRYMGEDASATAFFVADAVIWTAFVVFQVQGHKRESGYEEYAQTFARIADTGHSDDFYQALTEYNSSQEYKEAIKSEGRFELYPDANVAALEQYFLTNRPGDFEPWVWSSDEQRRDFRQQRSASKQAYRRSGYMVATALANRLISSFLAVRSARSYNNSLAQESSLRIEVGIPQTASSVGFRSGITLVKNF